MQRTVALVCSPAATRRPMVPSTAALGASRLGCASSSPNTWYLPATQLPSLLVWARLPAVHETPPSAGLRQHLPKHLALACGAGAKPLRVDNLAGNGTTPAVDSGLLPLKTQAQA